MKIARPKLFLTLLNLAVAAPVFADCTTQAPGNLIVNGAALWSEVPTASSRHFATDCDVDQFAWNNFLYLTGNDASGHPRFMSFAPWFKAMPAKPDKPSWPGTYTPLDGTQMLEQLNRRQAGDGFHLLDVNGKTVSYDIRINEDYLNYIAANTLYTKQAIKNAEAEFNANPSSGGIWLPPTSMTDKKSAMEIKTSWRNYGNAAGVCPDAIMHCEQDSTGIWWGLIGMHMVQKTPYHGEFIWASFEHVANSPDCAPGGSNPIKQNPGNLNANLNIPALKDKTGWNLFNFATYKGKDGTCNYPMGNSEIDVQCLTNPNPSNDQKTWVPVNVCRTDQLPAATDCTNAKDNLQFASCLNSHVQAGQTGKWQNYQLIGAEYAVWGATGFGAPLVGCWSFQDGTNPNLGLTCPKAQKGEESVSVSLEGTVNLANTTMETWMQKNINLIAGPSGKTTTWTQQDCFSCHQPTTATYQGDTSHLFGRAQQ